MSGSAYSLINLVLLMLKINLNGKIAYQKDNTILFSLIYINKQGNVQKKKYQKYGHRSLINKIRRIRR